jgi:hypothetical protein
VIFVFKKLKKPKILPNQKYKKDFIFIFLFHFYFLWCMITRSSSQNLISPLSNPERVIRHTLRVHFPTVEEMDQNNQHPPVGDNHQHMPAPNL